jgi:hypothetical protein
MANNTARFGWANFSQFGNTLLTASSTVSGRSVRWLRDQARSKTWRSATGWSFVQRFNDELAFNEDTYRRIAYVTPATYATGALAAAEIQTGMNAAGIDPLSLSPRIWLKADSLALADGATMTTWTDSSGNARHLNSVTGSPIWYKSVRNGRPAVRFDESSYFKASTSAVQWDDILDANGRGLIMAVVWCDTDHAVDSAVAIDAVGNRALQFNSTNVLARAYDGTQDTATKATSTGAWVTVAWYYDGTNVNAFSNDHDTAAAATAASGVQTTMTSDFSVGGNGGTTNLKGYICELIAVSGVVTEENRRRLTDYLVQKYALTNDTTTAAAWTNTYTCAYSSTTFKYTIARSAGALSFGFPWTLDAHEFRSMGTDIGFDVSADDTGATTYTGDNATYQSRHWVEMDLATTALTATMAAVLDHNSSTSGTYTIQAHTAPFWETGTPAYSATLAGDAVTRLLYFGADKIYRYWRVLVSDTTNIAGYNEFGILFLGPYTESDRGYAPGVTYPRIELSGVGAGDHGGPFFDDRPTINGFDLDMTHLSATDKSNFETMFSFVKNSRCFFFSRDAVTTPADTSYVFLPEGAFVEHMSSTAALYSISMKLRIPPQ